MNLLMNSNTKNKKAISNKLKRPNIINTIKTIRLTGIPKLNQYLTIILTNKALDY